MNKNHFDIFLNKNIPVVFFDRVFDYPGCVSVVIDNVSAGYEVTRHLIDQGCKRIAYIGGNLKREVYSGRFQGYKTALKESENTFIDDLVFIGDMSQEAGLAVAKKILKMKTMPDGVFAANDAVAVSLMMHLLDAGIKIPEEICIAGFNNEPLSLIVKPNLTTINYPARKVGEAAATALINKLNSKNAESIVLDHKLIIRESSLRKK